VCVCVCGWMGAAEEGGGSTLDARAVQKRLPDT
jgi:hypothetical protein